MEHGSMGVPNNIISLKTIVVLKQRSFLRNRQIFDLNLSLSQRDAARAQKKYDGRPGMPECEKLNIY